MKFSSFLTAALLPLSVLAVPASPANALEAAVSERGESSVVPLAFGDPTPVRRDEIADKILAARQANTSSAITSLGDLLGDLIPSLKAIVSLRK